MALFSYMQQTERLLRDTRQIAFNPQDLTDYINMARSQVAGDGRCIRDYATLPTINATQVYAFSTIVLAGTGRAGVLNVRSVSVRVTGGKSPLNNWPWPYFNQYYLNQTGTSNAQPAQWAQYGQGVNGSIFLFPTPDAIYTLDIDTVCYPIPLVSDTTVDAIPYPWTDTVPYYAAYLALLSPMAKKDGQAEGMLELYEKFKERARNYSTPDTLPYQFDQSGIKMPVAPAGVALPGGRGT